MTPSIEALFQRQAELLGQMDRPGPVTFGAVQVRSRDCQQYLWGCVCSTGGWYGEGLWTYDLGEEVWSILAIPPALDGIPGYEANAIQNVVSMALDVIPSG